MKYEINNDERELMICLLENEIRTDKEMLEDDAFKFEQEEKEFWTRQIKDLEGLKNKLLNQQFVMKGLTAEQEDYILESQLEEMRLRKYE